VLVVSLLAILAATRGLNVLAADHWFLALITGLGTAAAALFGYRWLSRTVEARDTVPELAPAGPDRPAAPASDRTAGDLTPTSGATLARAD